MLLIFSLSLLLSFLSISTSQTFLQTLPENPNSEHLTIEDNCVTFYCNGWRLAVETNNAGHWKRIPSQCRNFMDGYIKGPQFELDSMVVARHSYCYAKTILIGEDAKDAWIFDVDETLISNLQHYTANGYEAEVSNEPTSEQWVNSAKAALPWSLWLYKELNAMGFQLILLTGRRERHRNSTEQNLLAVGYHSWKMLILRESLDEDKTAVTYKSERRALLEAKGYRIHGSSGDQWSDLLGSPLAKRSFKVPNPMYHISVAEPEIFSKVDEKEK